MLLTDTDEQRKVLAEYGISITKSNELNTLLLDIDAKITEIGFNRDYELTAVGLKLQRIYDQIYMQNS